MAPTCWHDLLLAEAARCAEGRAGAADGSAGRLQERILSLRRRRPRKKARPLPPRQRPWRVSTINLQSRSPGWKAPPPCWARWNGWLRQGQWTPLYDKLTPYVLGMEEMPGFKGMKKRLTGDHKAAVQHPRGRSRQAV